MATTTRVSADESHRLIESLQTAGWPLRWIEQRAGLSRNSLTAVLYRPRVATATRDAIREAYTLLRAQEPPNQTHEERTAVTIARRAGARNQGTHPRDLPERPWEIEEALSA